MKNVIRLIFRYNPFNHSKVRNIAPNPGWPPKGYADDINTPAAAYLLQIVTVLSTGSKYNCIHDYCLVIYSSLILYHHSG
jgi:hypothetical protein